ncbi:MAG: hypothetical protein R3B45_17345, partial [Bdellovibrionota bacterium]
MPLLQGIKEFWRYFLGSLLTLCFAGFFFGCSAPKPNGVQGAKDLNGSDGNALPEYCNSYISSGSWSSVTSTKGSESNTLSLADPAIANYEVGVKLLIDNKCATSGCHATGGKDPILTDYAKVKAAGKKIISTSVDSSSMPKGADALSDLEKDLLQTWADLGYPEKAALTNSTTSKNTNSEAKQSSSDIEYADVTKVLDESGCLKCHGADSKNDVILEDKVSYDAIAVDVVPVIEKGHFGTLDESQKTLLDAYAQSLTGGGSAENSGDSTESGNTSKEVPPECQVKKEEAEGLSQLAKDSEYSLALNPPELKKCHDDGFLYDRQARDCHEAKLGASFT